MLGYLWQYFIPGFRWKDFYIYVGIPVAVFYPWISLVGFLHMCWDISGSFLSLDFSGRISTYMLGYMWQYFIPGFLW
jgi:hypothetical protein